MKAKAWYERPAEAVPAVRRDTEEQRAIIAALADLPSDHPAHAAFTKGVDTISLTHLVADRPSIVEALKAAYLDGFGRTLQGGSGFQPYRGP